MLLAKDKSWVLCTPPKTGSSSLISMLVNTYKVAKKITEKEAIGESVFPHGHAYRHGADYEGPGERIMVVRHPLERWSSLYWYAKKKKSQFLHKHTHEVNLYVEKWFESRQENPYQINNMVLMDYYTIFKPHKIFKLEEGLDKVLIHLGLPTEKISTANMNSLNLGWHTTKHMLTAKNRKMLEELAKPELKLFNYEYV